LAHENKQDEKINKSSTRVWGFISISFFIFIALAMGNVLINPALRMAYQKLISKSIPA
jgi:hypothetical protein